MAMSFTRAAAIELTGRDVPIDLNRIGTLHSACFHALGKPPIAEAHVDDWNRENPRSPITPVSRDQKARGENANTEEDPMLKAGDGLLQQLNYYRGKMIAPESWPTASGISILDGVNTKPRMVFSISRDLIDTALLDLEFAPNNPAVIIADEAQDLNPMQLASGSEVGPSCGPFRSGRG